MFFLLLNVAQAQDDPPDPGPEPPTSGSAGWKQKTGFIIGFGMNYALDDIYLTPTIDEVDRFVRLEKSKGYRANFSLGISYTFGMPQDVIRRYRISEDTYGLDIQRTIQGFTTAIFMNPGALANMTNTSVNSTADLGFGFGWRTNSFSFLGTVEVFQSSQPRQYFIDTYYHQEKMYVVNGEVQTAIDPNNDHIFVSKWFVAVGFKVALTLDVFKSFSGATGNVKNTGPSEK